MLNKEMMLMGGSDPYASATHWLYVEYGEVTIKSTLGYYGLQEGKREIPSEEELLAELPELVINYIN